MKVEGVTSTETDYKQLAIDRKEYLDRLVKKEQMETERVKSERIRTERMEKQRTDSDKGNNIDVSV